jgi:DNA-binding MarR family transcriptional regulator
MTDNKFRSLRAFKTFEQRSSESSRTLAKTSGGDDDEAGAISPLHVLSTIKAHADGIEIVDLASALHTSIAAVNAAILRLLDEKLVAREVQGKTERLRAL